MRIIQLYSFVFMFVAFTTGVYAEKVVEHQGTLEIDWSAAKIRQSSRVASSKSDFSWQDLDLDARRQGLTYLKNRVIELNRTISTQAGMVEMTALEQAKKAGNLVETTTWLKNTEYHSGGSLTHHFENRLSRAILREGLNFLDEKTQAKESPFTGLVFRLKNQGSPTGFYKIIDENSRVLMDLSHIHRSAFDERLMGRWYREPSRQEVSRSVGRRPLSVEVEFVSAGVLRMPAGRWRDAIANHERLVQEARIMIALPAA